MAMRLWETPVPMPNTTVKTQAADDTWLETARESKWLPELNKSIIPGCSVAWLARLIWDQEVAGSNPGGASGKSRFHRISCGVGAFFIAWKRIAFLSALS